MNTETATTTPQNQSKRAQRVQILAGIFMGTFMAILMSGFITAVNTGLDAGFLYRWLSAFGLALMAAIPLALFVSPRARAVAERLVG